MIWEIILIPQGPISSKWQNAENEFYPDLYLYVKELYPAHVTSEKNNNKHNSMDIITSIHLVPDYHSELLFIADLIKFIFLHALKCTDTIYRSKTHKHVPYNSIKTDDIYFLKKIFQR